MRVSNSMLARINTAALMKRQEDIVEVQSQIASGIKLQKPSDNPMGTAQKIDHETAIKQLDQYNRNISIGQARLESAEVSISTVTDALQRSRELALQAANASNSSNEHGAMASELEQIKQAIYAVANGKDTSGNYLFSGTAVKTQPFTGNTNVNYNGNAEQRTIQARNNLLIDTSFSGADVFLNIPLSTNSHTVATDPANTGAAVVLLDGNDSSTGSIPYTLEFTAADTYQILNADDGSVVVPPTAIPASGEIDFNGFQVTLEGAPEAGDIFQITPAGTQDIFTTFQNFIDALNASEDTATGKAKLRQVVNETLTALDTTLDSLNTQRSLVGTRLQTLDTVQNENDFTSFQLQDNLSDIRDTDLTEAISRLQEHTLALQVLQQTTTRTQSLNLFNMT
jgi:flagellar hook-associated protein 3 FlgL